MQSECSLGTAAVDNALKKDGDNIMNNFQNFFVGIWKGMHQFGNSLVAIINFILLLPVYFIGVGISAIIAKVSGKHFLKLQKEKKKSYWVDRKIVKPKMEDFYKQF